MTTQNDHGLLLDALDTLTAREFVEFYWEKIGLLDTDQKDELRRDIQEEYGDDKAKAFVQSYNFMQEKYMPRR